MRYPNLQITFTKPNSGTTSYRRWFFNHYIEDATLPYTLEAVLNSTNGNRGVGSTSVPVLARLVVLQGPGPDEDPATRTVLLAGDWKSWDGNPWTLTINENLFDGVRPIAISAEVDPEYRDGTYHAHVISRPIHMDPIPDRTTERYLFTASHRWRDGTFNWQGLGVVWYPGYQPVGNIHPYKFRQGAKWDSSTSVNSFYSQAITDCFVHIKNQSFAVGPEWRFGRPDEAPAGMVDASGGAVQYHTNNFQFDNAGASLALHLDGGRGFGNVGMPVAGFVESDDGLVVVSSIGRLAKVMPSGKVTTIVGHRAKVGSLTPMRSYTSSVRENEFEFVGSLDTPNMTVWNHIWDAIPDPSDPDILYVAATDNNRVDKVARSTGSITVLAGDPEGTASYVDGNTTDARFNKPRGLAIKDGIMYVGDAVNQAIRAIDLSTGDVTTLVQSAELISPHSLGSYDAVRDWAADGLFGEAKFMHPQHIRFTSDGSLISPMHHQLQLVEFDLDAGEVKTIHSDLPGAQWSEAHMSWLTMHIDKDGVAGPADTMYYAGWEHISDRVLDRQGVEVPVFNTGWNDAAMVEDRAGFDAAFNRRESQGYPMMAVPGPGCVWIAGVSGGGLLRVTPTSTAEERSVDPDKYQRGLDLWKLTPNPWYPSLSLIHGPFGFNMLGALSVEDFAEIGADAFRQWVADTYGRIFTDDEFDDLWYFIHHTSIVARGWAVDEEHPAMKYIREAEEALEKAKGELQ